MQGEQGGTAWAKRTGGGSGDRSLEHLEGLMVQILRQRGITATAAGLAARSTLQMGRAAGLQMTPCRWQGRGLIARPVGMTGLSSAACRLQGRKASPGSLVIYGEQNVSTCTQPGFRNLEQGEAWPHVHSGIHCVAAGRASCRAPKTGSPGVHAEPKGT